MTEQIQCIWRIGHEVEKKKGYKWPGTVVAVFKTLAGDERVVVECIVPGVEGALHIYSPTQLKFRERLTNVERCITCGRSDEDYASCDYVCIDPWHADAHLRKKNPARR